MIILVKFPTRQRKDKFFKTLNLYREMASDPARLMFVVSCDTDDTEMNNDAVRKELSGSAFVRYGNNKTKIEACNADIPASGWDILLLASDDMIPRVKGWDEIISQQMQQHFPDLDGVLHFWDGHNEDGINTLSIFGRKWYGRFGYVYNPVYRTMYCDTEFTEVAKMLNRVVYSTQVIIEHVHPYSGAIPFDSLYLRNNDSSFDSSIYFPRKKNNFFLKRTLIKQPGRFGDIIITLPIAKHFHDQNHIVYWQCPKEYHELFRNIDYVIPVENEVKADNIIDLSFGFGGDIEFWWQQNKSLFDSFVSAKYYLAGVKATERWNLKFNRNIEKESELRAMFPVNYILTHEETHIGKIIDIQHPNKVEFKPVEGFNVFDWYKVIEDAEEIHCIDSALSNFIESVPEFRHKKKTIYITKRETEYYLRSIYKNNWTLI